MSKAKQADVPAIYPLKGEHKKPEHVKPDEVRNKTGEQDHPVQAEPMEIPVIEEYAEVPKVHEHTPCLGETNIYQTPILDEQVRRPNPLLVIGRVLHQCWVEYSTNGWCLVLEATGCRLLRVGEYCLAM